jgi:hypothetical protein
VKSEKMGECGMKKCEKARGEKGNKKECKVERKRVGRGVGEGKRKGKKKCVKGECV